MDSERGGIMKNKKIIMLLPVIISGLVLVLFKPTSSYFIQKETAENVIALGKISVKLEEEFTPPENVLPGREFIKAPYLVNHGTKDEFVFLGVTIPKENITLLKEQGGILKNKGSYELFRMIAESSGTELSNPFGTADFDTAFSYHKGTPEEGWIFIEASSQDTADTYIFGYNKKISPDESTIKLFDKVKLKNFINGEAVGEKNIDIQPYAIQADSLNATELSEHYLDNVTENDLKIIFSVIERKAVTTP